MTKKVNASCRSKGFTFQSSFNICFASADEKENKWAKLGSLYLTEICALHVDVTKNVHAKKWRLVAFTINSHETDSTDSMWNESKLLRVQTDNIFIDQGNSFAHISSCSTGANIHWFGNVLCACLLFFEQFVPNTTCWRREWMILSTTFE